jgi:hypothetical protein
VRIHESARYVTCGPANTGLSVCTNWRSCAASARIFHSSTNIKSSSSQTHLNTSNRLSATTVTRRASTSS